MLYNGDNKYHNIKIFENTVLYNGDNNYHNIIIFENTVLYNGDNKYHNIKIFESTVLYNGDNKYHNIKIFENTLIPSLKFRLPYLINVHQSIDPFLLKSRGHAILSFGICYVNHFHFFIYLIGTLAFRKD